MTAALDTAALDTATDIVEPGETTTEQTYPYLRHGVDPRTLRAGGNTREVGDIRARRPELVTSVAEHGLNPMVSVINVAPDPDGGLRVLVGFHRTAAAVAIKELENPALAIDVLVHAPGTTRQDVLVAQGIENIHREGYTPTEEAGLYDQLALEGLDVEAIARNLSLPDEQIRAGLAVAASSRTRTAAAVLPDADLLILAQLAEFGDDEAAHQKLVDVLTHRPHNFEWTIGQLRREREQRVEQAQQSQRFAERGYTLVDDEDDLPDGVARLDELCGTEDVEPLDPAGHADCPGRGVYVWVDRDLELEVTEFCVEYADHGHRTLASMRIEAAEAKLCADGVPIADPNADGLAELRDLFADGQGERLLTAEEHAGCPGHAAYVEDMPYRSTVEVHYVCTDYVAHRHVPRTARAVPVQPERDAAWQSAERKRAGENNKLWRDAKTDRREWLTEYFAGWRNPKASPKAKANPRAKPKSRAVKLPARVHHWLALAPVLASDHLADAAPGHRYACTLLKFAEPQDNRRDHNPLAEHLRKQATTETQAVVIRLAEIIGACEEHWNLKYTENADTSWRNPSEDTCFYFELLDALGYPLSHVEQLVNNPDLDHEKWPHLVLANAGDDQAA